MCIYKYPKTKTRASANKSSLYSLELSSLGASGRWGGGCKGIESKGKGKGVRILRLGFKLIEAQLSKALDAASHPRALPTNSVRNFPRPMGHDCFCIIGSVN